MICFLNILLYCWENLTPLSQPIQNKTKTNHELLIPFSHTWHWLLVISLSSYWFIGLTVCVVIGQGNYFGFGFMTLNLKPIYDNANVLNNYYDALVNCSVLYYSVLL